MLNIIEIFVLLVLTTLGHFSWICFCPNPDSGKNPIRIPDKRTRPGSETLDLCVHFPELYTCALGGMVAGSWR